MPFPAIGARDLPRTNLSDHIEERLFRLLEQEKEQRAKLLGKNLDEVSCRVVIMMPLMKVQ